MIPQMRPTARLIVLCVIYASMSEVTPTPQRKSSKRSWYGDNETIDLLLFSKWCALPLLHLVVECVHAFLFQGRTAYAVAHILAMQAMKKAQDDGDNRGEVSEVDSGDCVLNVLGYLPREVFESK